MSATKIKLVYASPDEPGRQSIIEIWTEGPHAACGHVLDALLGCYQHDDQIPMRIEVIPNAPDVPSVQSRSPEEGEPQ